jgi:hypothetical protein
MKRLDGLIDGGIVAAGVIAAVGGLRLASSGEGRFNAVFIVAAAALAAVTLNHTIPRRPRLVVHYRNPEAGGRPVVWPYRHGEPGARLHVIVENRGRGPAEAVEVRFDNLGVSVWNESGNPGNPAAEVDRSLSPPRFEGGLRIVNPGESLTIAALSDAVGGGWQVRPAHWTARAKHMPEQHGVVEITLLPGPPSGP